MRARTRAELFQLVCEAAVHGGQFASTIIALTEPESDFLRVVASAGPKGDMQRTVKIAIADAYPEGRGVSGTAFRTLQPCIMNDYLADIRGGAFHERARREGNKSGAALPLLVRGNSITRWLDESAQKTFPLPSTATPLGLLSPVKGRVTSVPYPLPVHGTSSTVP